MLLISPNWKMSTFLVLSCTHKRGILMLTHLLIIKSLVTMKVTLGGWRDGSTVEEYLLLLQRVQVWFRGPHQEHNSLTPGPGCLQPSSGLLGHWHTCNIHAYIHPDTSTHKAKINRVWLHTPLISALGSRQWQMDLWEFKTSLL